MTATATVEKTPVLVTRGSNTGFFSQSIDWLEGTFKKGAPINLPDILSQTYVDCRAFNGYTVASLYSDGRTLMQNPDRPEMGQHLTWSGDACRNCPVLPVSLVKHLCDAKFAFTRIDFAVDLINCNINPADATEEINNDRHKSKAQQFPFWADAKGKGYTQYIGKKTSEVYARIYDKAAEMGVEQDHVRVELITRHGRANFAAHTLTPDTDFRGLVVSFIDFKEWSEWNKAMDATEIKLPSERKETNTEKWLLDAVAPALARVIYFSGNSDFYEKFKDEVMNRLEELSNKQRTVE